MTRMIVTLEKSGLLDTEALFFVKGNREKIDWNEIRKVNNGWPKTPPPAAYADLLDRFERNQFELIILTSCQERARLGLTQYLAASSVIGPTWRTVGKTGERKLVLRADDSAMSDLQWKAETIAQLCGGELAVLVDSDEQLVPLLLDTVTAYSSLEEAAEELLLRVGYGTGTAGRAGWRY